MKNLKLILSLLLLTQTIFAQEERIDAVLKDSIGTLPAANVIVEEIKDSDSILTDGKFALTGSFFDKRANQFVPYDGYIVLKKMGNREVIDVKNGNFELLLDYTQQNSFPLEVSFQCIGYKSEVMYFETANDLLKIKNEVKIYFTYLDEVGLVLKAKTSFWYKLKRFFKKKNREEN